MTFKYASATRIGMDISERFRPPRRMPVVEAVKNYMRMPSGSVNSLPWEPELTPYMTEPMNCLTSREFDAVVFVGPSRTGKTEGLVDGWIVYGIVCDPGDMLLVHNSSVFRRIHRTSIITPKFLYNSGLREYLY
jgi:phage terminase large subunit GpA-like protein